uniref:Nucleoside-diphosphate kinase n=1 Tax=Pseudictyota dubia TaxID=2749911 RepID=A0A7R9W5A8_9STRA|mmetsp:Transcript_32512/g.59775  ORF Transcript_32512/g.59775 Transcript_32512/m.59775 type:complete len:407 (+) Transcript_32512:101-1321(+)|eukprot:CAMPEP_0197463444 /NCGR_PEP_ID=MMETSP1175-20131217/61827_1 /TAXON_ID=1003142 /ORGANISM="Triceratium dubium, Strain CCMP147" /LENGTH=406 /DNA_ID=CAMNT_0042999213 /DNA_START=83 /DNA_END=1303 /DNA_ORIENTATION=+
MFSRSLRLASNRVPLARRFADAAKTSEKAAPAAAAAPSPASGGFDAALPLAAVALLGAGFAYSSASGKSSSLQTQTDALQAQNAALQDQINDLQVQISGKTNSAFVFIKPHACKGTPGKVEAIVEESFKKNGIRITGSGEMAAETIDKNMHIDTHYGAIASKAVKLKPSELNVPDKGKAQFEKMFGEKWEDVVAAGKVFNAMDGAAKLGVDAAGLNEKWGTLTKGKDLIKFGGGFYCGKVDGIYVMNGFYMAMRAAYCNPGEKIHWYTVSWPADALSWADFRGVVLGPTDPSTAPEGSIRRTILDQYQQLGLKSKPNTGDNGVHASASPFEGLAERLNWLGADLESDQFGKGMLAATVSKDAIMKWSGDCQVEVEGETAPGKTMSVFDSLEDLNADDSLEKMKKIH